MLLRCLFVTVFVCFLNINNCVSINSKESLESVLESAAQFFEKLQYQYGSQEASPELYKLIDDKLENYVRTVKKSTYSSRGKRQLDFEKEIGILDGLQKIPKLELADALDVTFFIYRNGGKELWYAATLKTSGIHLLQYQGNFFNEVGFYNFSDGFRIISHSCESATLLVIQRSTGEALVVRLSIENSIQTLHEVQTLDIPASSYSIIWRGIKQIYLAVSSPKNLTVFTWLGKHFDRIQTDNIGAEKLVAFQTGGSMHLIATNNRRTSILKFILNSNKFVVVQKLVDAVNANAFHLEKSHLSEHFVALTNKKLTVIYKQFKHRFVPFQEISGAEIIRSFANGEVIMIFLIKDGEMRIYQYDGWKFVESGIREIGVFDVIPVSWRGEEIFAVKKDQYSWSFRRISWRRRKTWGNFREEMKNWCKSSLDKSLRIAGSIPKIEGAVRIGKGFIEDLRVREINGQSVAKFAQLNNRWNAIINETSEQKIAVKNCISRTNTKLTNVGAKSLRVKCTNQCHAMRTETGVRNDFLKRLRKTDKYFQNLNIKHAKVSSTKNLRCPIPEFKFHDMGVTGLINGINFAEFSKDVLKITGDQEITDSQKFADLRVLNAKVPLDVVFNETRQDIVAKKIRTKKLNIKAGGLLLPLKGSASICTGSLTVPKAKINGLVDMRGKIRGRGGQVLSPMTHIAEPINIYGDFELGNVKILEKFESIDITRSTGRSFDEIISNAVALNSKHVPNFFKFRNDKVSWKNMNLRRFPYKWATKKHSEHLVISGIKYATSNITLGKLAYTNLPTARLPLHLCGVAVSSDDIWESNLAIGRGRAKSVKGINIFDESELSELYLNTATSLNDVSWESKNLTGRITVNGADIGGIFRMDYKALTTSVEHWAEPGRLKGPINVHNLKLNSLITPVGFKQSLPLEVGYVKSENISIGKLNGFDFDEFLNNIVTIDDTVSLTNVTFEGDLEAKELLSSQTSFVYQQGEKLGYLGSKELKGTLEADSIILPYSLNFLPSNYPVNIIANGNVNFAKEPTVTNVNNRNLTQLYDDIWINDKETNISAEFVELENVSFANLSILKSFETPSLGPWKNIENRLLSRVKSQIINFNAHFNSLQAPNLFGSAKSHLRSNVSYLNDLEFNSLKNNNVQVIKNNWSFDELIVTDSANIRGRINNLNFATGVVRYDVQKNVIKGRKIVRDLTARNIGGMKFGKFARNSLRIDNENRTVIVKGVKRFENVQMENMRVDGTVMGSRIENSLSKKSAQDLKGLKIFTNTLKTPEIITNRTINDINLKHMTEYQLKKRADVQIIETPILLSNNLMIFGNLTIDGFYQGVELKNFKSTNNSFVTIVKKTTELLNFAEGIDVALENRAIYWNRLELLERNSTPLISDPIKDEPYKFYGLGNCRMDRSSLYCNGQKVFDFSSTFSKGSRVIEAGIVKLSGISLVSCVTSDPEGGVFIYQFDHDENTFSRVAALHLPGIIQGSFTTTTDCLWISLRLKDDLMILRYELWDNHFQEWILPGSSEFLMSTTPTEELLILRYDGVWKLGGLAGPRNVFAASLNGQIDTFSFGSDYYVQLTNSNVTTLLKTRYIGD